MSTEISMWILFFALGVSSEKEVIDLMDLGMKMAEVQMYFSIQSIMLTENVRSFVKAQQRTLPNLLMKR